MAFLFLTIPSLLFLWRYHGAWILQLLAWIAGGIVYGISEHLIAVRLPYHDATVSFLAIVPMMIAYRMFHVTLVRFSFTVMNPPRPSC